MNSRRIVFPQDQQKSCRIPQLQLKPVPCQCALVLGSTRKVFGPSAARGLEDRILHELREKLNPLKAVRW